MSLNQNSTVLEGYVDNNTITTEKQQTWQFRFINNPIINTIIYLFSILKLAIGFMFKGIWEFLKFFSPVFEILMWIIILF
jgi:plastocyanin domain-containing protein